MMDELDYILAFIEETFFDIDTCREQLRCLWTAYCLHKNLCVDTAAYDRDLCGVWASVELEEPDTGDWSDMGTFSNYMAAYLV